MRDIVERLKVLREDTEKGFKTLGLAPSHNIYADAADEIERLRNSNTALRSAVEALSKELTTEAQSMMRQPEAGVIRALAERLHTIVFRRKWRGAS